MSRDRQKADIRIGRKVRKIGRNLSGILTNLLGLNLSFNHYLLKMSFFLIFHLTFLSPPTHQTNSECRSKNCGKIEKPF